MQVVIYAATMELGGTSTVEYISLATRNSLQCAEQLGARSLGFVAFGTGVGGVAREDAAPAMVDQVREHLHQGAALERIVFTIHKDPEALSGSRRRCQGVPGRVGLSDVRAELDTPRRRWRTGVRHRPAARRPPPERRHYRYSPPDGDSVVLVDEAAEAVAAVNRARD